MNSIGLPFVHLLLLVVVMTLPPAISAQKKIPSPEEVFGFRMGADRKLIDWTQITAYFRTVDDASDRVIVEELGKSTLGRPFIMAIISS